MLKLQKDGYFRETFYFNSKQYSARGKTEKEAIKKAHEKKKALERGDIGISNNMTVRSWAYEWLDTFKKGTIVDKSYKRYKAHIDNVILPVIGNMRIRDVRDVHLQKILNLRKGYSKSDTKKILFTIQAMFKQARLSRLIQYDPAEGTLKMPLTTQGK
ncbi:MAG: N-terminal phage integrase SAM-like domain-containing protein, partial [Oscillospiraceae bacterium]|nr:N-terminal phage integrase SAM-like domain-containing protein [Oscillospiraceae bacterium]